MTTRPPIRILIVDDQTAGLRALCETLGDAGYETEGAVSGEAALSALRKASFDLLLADLMMPGMDGLETLSAAQKIDPYLVAIVMTGQGTIETAVAAMQAGAFDYVLKPIRLNVLLAMLARAQEAVGQAAIRRTQDLELKAKQVRIERTLHEKRIDIVVQSIVRLSTMRIIGVEALTRFREPPARPDLWFADAAEIGLGENLELLSIEKALELLPSLPGNIYMSVNVSPAVACSGALAKVLGNVDPSRVVLEITEQTAVADYGILLQALDPLRRAGIRLSVDDAGAGYASFNHILTLRPDIIKLDTHLTRGLDLDPVRLSLAEALVAFAKRLGANLVAEGVETQSELDALLRIGSHAVQGYFTGRPGPLPLKEITVAPTISVARVPRAGTIPEVGSTFKDFVDPLLKNLLEETNLDVAYMTVLHHSDQTLEHRYVLPEGLAALPTGLTIPWRDSLCIRCRNEGIVWTPEAGTILAAGSYADGKGVQTYFSMPIRTPAFHDTLGTLCAAGFERRYLSDRALLQAEHYARQIADRIVREGVDEFMEASDIRTS